MNNHKTMTALEEDELFGAHLSMDFEEEDVHKNWPWKSTRPRNDGIGLTRNVCREPYELLDDVPPADIPSQTNLMQSKYPIDAPTYGSGISSHHARRRVTFRLEHDSSPYSIDDYSEMEAFSTHSRNSGMSYTYMNYVGEDNILIAESRSDSEMSVYESMNDNYFSSREESENSRDDDYESSVLSFSGRNELSAYEYDNNSYDSQDTEDDSTIDGNRSRGSMSTFDHFYQDAISESMTGSTGTQTSEMSIEVSLSDNVKKISETLQNDSFNFTIDTTDQGPEETERVVENIVDDSLSTPLRSNARTKAFDQSTSNRSEEYDALFHTHGADSFLSSKRGLSADSSGSAVSSSDSSQQSGDSALQHLADSQNSPDSSPSRGLNLEPYPTTHLRKNFRLGADPPEEMVSASEFRLGEQRVAQEPDGYKQFRLFPDALMGDYQISSKELNDSTDSQARDDCISSGWNENERDLNMRQPVGESYNDMKHKLVQFEDVYEEDEVRKVCKESRDFDFTTEISISSSKSSCNENTNLAVDDGSIISHDTDIRRLANQHTLRNKDKEAGRMTTYAVKDKDSIESGIKIDSDGGESGQSCSIGVYMIQEIESMEAYIDIGLLETKENENFHSGLQAKCSVMSPPLIKRKEFNFIDMQEQPLFDIRSYSESIASSHIYFAGDEKDASVGEFTDDRSFEDESEASDDPSVFPSKTIFQMKLNQKFLQTDIFDISEDLVEKACGHLSRGCNCEALDTLTVALKRAENSMNHAKIMLEDHYLAKKNESKMPGINAGMNERIFQDQLEANFHRAASEMADIMNNIGVVHEMDGDMQKAMNSFREALTIYRNVCNRFENTGDSDVDRTVSNIMQMGIAMRSQKMRLELHSKARNLEKHILSCDDTDSRLNLCMEKMDVLVCVIDVERESLGRNHPSVGFTLMTKGDLHLQMQYIDEAVKDYREAIDILKRGLGQIHPEVGRAMMRLADIFNYHCNGDWELDKDTARSLYEEALTPLRESFGNVSRDLALAHNSIGIIFAMQNDTTNAMKSFYDALVGYGVRAKEGEEVFSTPVCPDVFFAWVNVGDLHSKRNEWQLALRSFQKACTLFRSLNENQKDYLLDIGPRRITRHAKSKSSMSFDNNDTLLSAILQKIGKAQCLLKKYGKSIETLQEALRIQEVLLMCNKGSGSNKFARDVARVLGNIGEVHMLSEYQLTLSRLLLFLYCFH